MPGVEPTTSCPPKYATLPEWCRISGMGRTNTYLALSRGDLKAHKLGSRLLIDVEHGLAWIASLPTATIRVRQPKRAA